MCDYLPLSPGQEPLWGCLQGMSGQGASKTGGVFCWFLQVSGYYGVGMFLEKFPDDPCPHSVHSEISFADTPGAFQTVASMLCIYQVVMQALGAWHHQL